MRLEEIHKLYNYIENKNMETLICDVEETDEYMKVLEYITLNAKHIISEYLKQAIECGFDEEMMVQDYCIPEDFIEIIKKYKNCEIFL